MPLKYMTVSLHGAVYVTFPFLPSVNIDSFVKIAIAM